MYGFVALRNLSRCASRRSGRLRTLEEEHPAMKKHVQPLVSGFAAVGLTLGLGVVATPALADVNDEYKVLVVGKTLGFRHSHIDDTTVAITQLGVENGFTVDVWDPAQRVSLPTTPFTSAEDLSQYASIIFASPVDGTNSLNPAYPRLLNDTELAAFQGYIRSGGGYVGLHAATDTMHTVPWYSELTGGGARFVSHPAQQTATMRVENPSHPSTTMLPTEWVRFDEWYNFSTNPREDVHVLITLDEATYNPGNNAMGADHPIAWCHNFEGGRSWYEGAGHTDASWADPLFLQHVLKGIEWTAGLVSGGGDCVTFTEVDGILADLSDGSMRYAKLSSQLADYLAQAEAAADAGDHVAAIATLTQAQGKAHGLQDDVLVAKLGDLVEWQEGLLS
jgi:type 1 glutamine amidotransferase